MDNVGPVYCDRCARGGPAVRLSPVYNVLVNLAANPKFRVSPQLAAIYTRGDEGRSYLWRVRPYVVMRPSTPSGNRARHAIPAKSRQHAVFGDRGGVGADSTHYLFGHLAQDLLSFTGRIDVTLRPTMSLQLYAEPFVTAGGSTTFGRWQRLVRPIYEDRFRSFTGAAPNGDFNEKSFNASAVVRWEYRPASTLFVVWTQSREQDDADAGNFGARRDYRNLFAARPDNVFLIKAAYWLGRLIANHLDLPRFPW